MNAKKLKSMVPCEKCGSQAIVCRSIQEFHNVYFLNEDDELDNAAEFFQLVEEKDYACADCDNPLEIKPEKDES